MNSFPSALIVGVFSRMVPAVPIKRKTPSEIARFYKVAFRLGVPKHLQKDRRADVVKGLVHPFMR